MPDTPDQTPVAVVGIGADGWSGLTDLARRRLRAADVILGSARQLRLVETVAGGKDPASAPRDGTPDRIPTGDRVTLPSPLLPALSGLLDQYAGRSICVLASGDPLFYGIGATLIRLLGADRVEVLTHPSSASLACARLGWSWPEAETVSLVGRPVDHLRRVLHPGRRLLVLSVDGRTPAVVADLLTSTGFGPSRLTVLEDLGGPREKVHSGLAQHWAGATTGPLNVIGVECVAGEEAVPLPLSPGLPDEAYEHDGQLTKRDLRAITLARLSPLPGQLLWDVGAGAGSIAIEWMRSHPSCRAIAIESRPDRASRIVSNAAGLGVPHLDVVIASAPEALSGLAAPQAVFVGGGASVPGVIEACWAALARRGRLVVNAVTLETERVLADWYTAVGGELTRVAVSRAAPIGGFTGWRPMLSVTQWTVTKP